MGVGELRCVGVMMVGGCCGTKVALVEPSLARKHHAGTICTRAIVLGKEKTRGGVGGGLLGGGKGL